MVSYSHISDIGSMAIWLVCRLNYSQIQGDPRTTQPKRSEVAKSANCFKNKTMVTLHDDYSPLKCMQSVILRAIDVVDVVYSVFSVCYNEFFFFCKMNIIYYKSQLHKFICEQFIDKFPNREPPMKSSISRLIQKLEIWGRALWILHIVAQLSC